MQKKYMKRKDIHEETHLGLKTLSDEFRIKEVNTALGKVVDLGFEVPVVEDAYQYKARGVYSLDVNLINESVQKITGFSTENWTPIADKQDEVDAIPDDSNVEGEEGEIVIDGGIEEECDEDSMEEADDEMWTDEEGNEWGLGEWEYVGGTQQEAGGSGAPKKRAEWLKKLVKNPKTGRMVQVGSLPADLRAQYNPKVTKKAAQDHEKGFKNDMKAARHAKMGKKKMPAKKSNYDDHLKKAADDYNAKRKEKAQKRDKGERHQSQFSDSIEASDNQMLESIFAICGVKR